MLWACLHFPDLPLHAVFDAEELGGACAVVDGPRNRLQVAFANAVADRRGARVGKVLAAARAACAQLQARPRDRAAEQRLLVSLAAWAYRFSSQVSIAEPDALLIEVGASLRLFGGWPALQRRLRHELAALGHAPALAVAPAAAAARVLAANHDGFFADRRAPMLAALDAVPLARCGLGAGAIALLYNVGARTLRDAFALPRAELGRRVGAAELAALERLRGGERDALPLYQPPPRFAHKVEFQAHVEAWPPLLFPLRRLCTELALFLAARDGGVQRCELRLEHEERAATRVMIELLAPQRDARVLYDLVRSRLERVALADAVSAMALIADDLPEFRPRHQDLFEPQREQGLEWPELAERLRAHLGDGAVRRLATVGDHRPEHAWRFASAAVDAKADAAPRRKPAARKAWVAAEDEPDLPSQTAPKRDPGRAISAPDGIRDAPAAAGAPLEIIATPAQANVSAAQATAAWMQAGAPEPIATQEQARAVPSEAVAAQKQTAAAPALVVASQAPALRPFAPRQPPASPQARLQAQPHAPAASEYSLPMASAAAHAGVAETGPEPIRTRPLRPLWLLPRALPLRGPPPRVLAGPERIESGWWDGADARRDYYVVQMRNGQRAWAYLPAGARDGWMLHGWFA